MRLILRRFTLLLLLACFAVAAPLPVEADEAAIPAPVQQIDQIKERIESFRGLSGRVFGDSDPLVAARVYAYRLAGDHLSKVATDAQGRFAFADLPVGLYKLIAHKPGFVPAVLLLTRTATESYQFVELELERESIGAAPSTGRGFWSVRADIPPDVLREIAFAELEETLATDDGDGRRFQGRMEAITGVDQIAAQEEGQVTGGRLGLEGRLGRYSIGVRGDYRTLEARDFTSTAGSGAQASALSVDLAGGRDTRVTVTSSSNHWDLAPQPADSIDYEHHRVSVSQGLGDRGSSYFAAQYTSENNFHRHGWIDPAGIPEASRRWRLEGGYSTALGERTTVEAGLRYREHQAELETAGLDAAETADPLFVTPIEERVDMFGRGGTQLQPALFVEYGLYSTLRDGSLSFAPRGGVVVQLGSNWQAATTLSHELYDEARDRLQDFAPLLFRADGECDLAEEQCYKLLFSRRGEQDEEIRFGAVHREFGDTARLYFSENAFDRFESLYLVPGDRLPEVQFSMSRRLAPRVLAHLQSNLATGGGGIFHATDRNPYENEVRYLVTSLDTQFQASSTGLFLAFHRLEQALTSLSSQVGSPEPYAMERLQVMLTQDLDFLLDLATDWAIRLDVELSRGSSPGDPFGGGDELRKRFLGGIAIRF